MSGHKSVKSSIAESASRHQLQKFLALTKLHTTLEKVTLNHLQNIASCTRIPVSAIYFLRIRKLCSPNTAPLNGINCKYNLTIHAACGNLLFVV